MTDKKYIGGEKITANTQNNRISYEKPTDSFCVFTTVSLNPSSVGSKLVFPQKTIQKFFCASCSYDV